MDSPEIIFYVVAALIYFLTKKKKKKPQLPPVDSDQPIEQDESTEQQQPALSFEELLKELTGGKSAPKPIPPQQEPREEPVVELVEERPIVFEAKPRRELGEEMELLTSSFEDTTSKKTYSDSIRTSTKTKKQTESVENASRFDAYKITDNESLAGEIKAMLTDPDDVKKAVILQEVLARKF